MDIFIRIYIPLIFKRIALFLIMIFLCSLVYFFYNEQTIISNYSFKNPLYEHIRHLDLWLYLVVYFICISVISLLGFIILSLYYNIRKEYIANTILTYEKNFSVKLTDYLLSDMYDNPHAKKSLFRKIKKDSSLNIQIEALFSAYTKIQETVALDLSEKCIHMLKEVDAYKHLKYFLYSTDLSERILAMKMLSYLRIHDFESRILKYSDSRNYALRTEAFAALVRLMEKDHHLINLIGEKHKLSMLDINVIVNAVLKNFKMNINYNALLSSTSEYKTIIGLILAKYRYKKDFSNVIPILNHIGNSNLILNKFAWDSFLSLVPTEEAVDIIVNRFQDEKQDVKILILQKTYAIDNEQYINFLQKIILSQPLLIKIEAMKNLYNKNNYYLEEYKASKDSEISQAYNEIYDLSIL